MALEKEREKYRAFKGTEINWLERFFDALSGFDERQDYTNRLLMRILLALGAPVPPPGEGPPIIIQPVAVPLGRPISKLLRLTITSLTYVTLVEWEIPAQHTGELFEVSMATTSYAKTQFRLVLANEEQWADQYLISALTQEFRGNKLTELMKVTLQVQSSDGTEITAYGAIAGKLIAPQ